jgi:hypothetical protein
MIRIKVDLLLLRGSLNDACGRATALALVRSKFKNQLRFLTVWNNNHRNPIGVVCSERRYANFRKALQYV